MMPINIAKRPVYLNLFRIHLPLAGWVSIMHRVSGALLFAAMPVGVWALSLSLESDPGFRQVAGWAALPLAKASLLLLIWAFAHHLFAGLRHLALDMHWGVELSRSRRSGLVVLLVSSLVTLVVAWGLYA